MLAASPAPMRPMPAFLLRACVPALMLLCAGCVSSATTETATCSPPATAMARVQLIFGSTRQDGSLIDEDTWRQFLSAEVTPRFPDGLTQFEGYGQWKRPDGVIVRLPSRTLLIWYAPADDANARIDAVREAFKTRFQQISVMRVDGQDCVSF